MTPRHALRSLALAALAHAAGGCSYLFMERAPDVVAAPDYPVHCTSSRVAPVADAVYAGSAGFAALMFAAMPRCSDDHLNPGARTCSSPAEKAALIAAPAAVAVALGVVARQGFEAASTCDAVKDLNALCITGREDACRALTPRWTPRRPPTPGTEWQPAGPGVPPVDVPVPGGSGCTKDVDCKGTRVCERGACVEPGAKPAP